MLNIQSMSNFIDVYNITQNCQTNTLYTVDVIKSYLFDSNIQILDNIDNPVIFINTYKSIDETLKLRKKSKFPKHNIYTSLQEKKNLTKKKILERNDKLIKDQEKIKILFDSINKKEKEKDK